MSDRYRWLREAILAVLVGTLLFVAAGGVGFFLIGRLGTTLEPVDLGPLHFGAPAIVAPLVEESLRLLMVLALARRGRLVMLSAGFAASLELLMRLASVGAAPLALFVGISFMVMHLVNTAVLLWGRGSGSIQLLVALALALAYHALLNAVGHHADSRPVLLALVHGLTMVAVFVVGAYPLPARLRERRLGRPAG